MMWNAVRQKLGVSARARLLTVAGLCAVVWTLAAYNPKQEARRTMQPEQVLQELDAAFGAVPVSLYTDPHHFKVADARLTVFRAPKHWVVVIEKIEYFSRMYGSVDCFKRFFTVYGNCLERGWFVQSDALWENEAELPFDDTPDIPRWLPTRQHFRYFWAGKWWEVSPTPQQLHEAGIDPQLLDEVDRKEWQENPDILQPVEWLRYLCYHLNHPFFASETRLREVVREALSDPSIEPHLQIVLQTREWEHPDYLEEQLPSHTESFRVIAEIIATGDASLWACVDRTRFNSHWRYWMEKERAQSGEADAPLSEDEQLFRRVYARYLQETVGTSDGIVILTRMQTTQPLELAMELPAQVVVRENMSDEFVQRLVARFGEPLEGESFRDWLRWCAESLGISQPSARGAS